MDKLFSTTSGQLLAVFLSALMIYSTTIILARIFGKRSFAKMSSFDFAMTIAVGALIGTTILSPNVSIFQGVTGIGSLYIFQHLIGFLRRYEAIDSLVTNSPIYLMKDSKVLDENLKKAQMTTRDLQAILRKSNITDRSQVMAVIFETTGDVSVLRSDKVNKIEDWLLEGIEGK